MKNENKKSVKEFMSYDRTNKQTEIATFKRKIPYLNHA